MVNIREGLQEIFRIVFGDEELILTDELTADDVDGWDSLMHINLIVAVEKHFQVKFATAEISRLKEQGQTVGSLIQVIEEKLAAGPSATFKR